jgi:hypothetical protein
VRVIRSIPRRDQQGTVTAAGALSIHQTTFGVVLVPVPDVTAAWLPGVATPYTIAVNTLPAMLAPPTFVRPQIVVTEPVGAATVESEVVLVPAGKTRIASGPGALVVYAVTDLKATPANVGEAGSGSVAAAVTYTSTVPTSEPTLITR